eukprot:m.3080 g.3080  ORF g.3080 m.3080 type:complete len:468 (-) comp2660_c0_seq1:83-1486(-)
MANFTFFLTLALVTVATANPVTVNDLKTMPPHDCPPPCKMFCKYGFTKDDNGCLLCQCKGPPQDSCKAGTYTTTDGKCVPCKIGTYNPYVDAMSCMPCSVCPSSMVVREKCTARSDTVCMRPSERFPTTTMGLTTTALPYCNYKCQDNIMSCLKKNSMEYCEKLAAAGYICTPPVPAPQMCDAKYLFPRTTPSGDCPEGMVFSTCGGCDPSCYNPRPICPLFCKVGCFCQKGLVMDDVSGTCINKTDCPLPNKCDGYMGRNYLDTGNDARNCATVPGHALVDLNAKCTLLCADGICKGLTSDDKEFCERFSSGSCKYYSERCKFSEFPAGDKTGPSFVCSLTDDGDAGWTMTEEGNCKGGTDPSASVCDYMEGTQCLQKGGCESEIAANCAAVVKNSFLNCQFKCFPTPTSDGCAQCLADHLFDSKIIKKDVPDVFTCCGCLSTYFSSMGINSKQLINLMQLPCKQG